MNRLKSFIKILGLYFATSIFSGCSTDININDYIDNKKTLSLIITKQDSTTRLSTSEKFEIAINSDKYKKLVQWGNENLSGWQWTPVSYIGDICVVQEDFSLLYTIKGQSVILSFTDKDGKPNQYAKTIKQGELDFLAGGQFSKENWEKTSDLGLHPNREAMVNDLLTNYKLKGIHYNDLVKMLGQPDFWEPSERVIYYGIATNYGLDIDPTGLKALSFEFNADSIITDYTISESTK